VRRPAILRERFRRVPDIVEPDDLTVGGIPERHPEAVEIEWAARYAP